MPQLQPTDKITWLVKGAETVQQALHECKRCSVRSRQARQPWMAICHASSQCHAQSCIIMSQIWRHGSEQDQECMNSAVHSGACNPGTRACSTSYCCWPGISALKWHARLHALFWCIEDLPPDCNAHGRKGLVGSTCGSVHPLASIAQQRSSIFLQLNHANLGTGSGSSEKRCWVPTSLECCSINSCRTCVPCCNSRWDSLLPHAGRPVVSQPIQKAKP